MSEAPAEKKEEFRLPLELTTVLKTLRRKLWLLILIFILACVLGVVGALMLGTQKYEATTVVYYQPIESYVPDTFRIFQSVGESTELSYEQGGGLIKFESSNNSLKNRVNMVKIRPNIEELRTRLELEKSLEQISASINVYVTHDTNLMSISAKASTPQEAQLMANTMRDIFLESNNTRIGKEIKEQLDGLKQQFAATSKELNAAKSRFADFIELHQIRDIKTQTTIYASELVQLELSLRSYKQQIEAFRKRVDRIKSEILQISQADSERDALLSQQAARQGITANEATSRISRLSEKIENLQTDITDPIELERLKTKLTIAENEYVKGLIERSEFEAAYYDYQVFLAKTTKTDEIQLLKQEIDDIRMLPQIGDKENTVANDYLQKVKLILLENELDLISLELEYSSALERFETMNQSFIDLPTISQTYSSLNGNVVTLEAESLGIEKILNQYKTISEKTQSDFYIINDAALPLWPMDSNKKIIAIVIAFVVFMVGFFILLVVIVTDTRIKSRADAKQKLNMRVIASLPFLKNSSLLLPGKEEESHHIELYRILARPLRLKYPKQGATFLVTSTAGQEGKSTAVINLATVFGRQDERVLVIDAQVRPTRNPSPLQQYYMNDPSDAKPNGLGEYLSYRVASSEEIISNTVIPGVDMILKNEDAIIPDLLQSARMADLMQELKKLYSVIIIEGAPVNECVDSEILTQYADAILYVTACDMLRPPVIQRALTRIKNTSIPLEGIILTKIRSVYSD
ncbi:MAG: AAA family ATPase [Sphaerochaeta sp.]|nr:AAA family ATPase [Sphaerochaeta sp.]